MATAGRIIGLLLGLLMFLALVAFTRSAEKPQCVSWLFATVADTAFYETHCVGGARPDSIGK